MIFHRINELPIIGGVTNQQDLGFVGVPQGRLKHQIVMAAMVAKYEYLEEERVESDDL